MARTTNAKTAPAADAETEAEAPAGITATALAAKLETDPKTFRRFLRGQTDNRAGKGGRWLITPELEADLTKSWNERGSKGTKPELKDSDADSAE